MVKSVDPNDAPPISKSEFLIAGILTTVYGLGELDPTLQNVACLWLLHPRLETQASMEPIALSMLKHWTQEKSQKKAQGSPINLIVASFDQRNHGSREVSKLANESWQTGNPNHAVDMFSIYHGTSLDLSNLITYISSYIFPRSNYLISTHMVCGISLGGHSAWVSFGIPTVMSTGVIRTSPGELILYSNVFYMILVLPLQSSSSAVLIT